MMMDAKPATEDDNMISALYEACIQGHVSTLTQLMQRDPLILTKFSLTTISETPLHISASLGHVNFTRTLLLLKPKLASELDSLRRSPLHLAAADGHIEIVHELLQAYGDACLVRDQDGKIPLHYAAMRGRADVVRDLIRAMPDSVKVLDRGETVFHLCIKYNQLETLKVLVEFVGENNEMLNTRDCNTGNTILHLAVMHKQTENIKYLLSLPGIKKAANTENQMGFTALDVLEYSPSDFKRLEFQCLLMEAGIKSKRNSFYGLPLQQNLANDIAVADNVRKPEEKKWYLKCLNHVNMWFKHEDGWLENTRGNLMIVATVISTMSYQAVIQPPDPLKKGETFGVIFMMCNNISFFASLSVILLLLSGIPLRNKFAVWLLSLVMLVNLAVLAAAYVSGTIAAWPKEKSPTAESPIAESPKAESPKAELPKAEFAAYKILTGFSVTIFALLTGLSILFLAIRFSVWIGKKLYRLLKCIVDKIV